MPRYRRRAVGGAARAGRGVMTDDAFSELVYNTLCVCVVTREKVARDIANGGYMEDLWSVSWNVVCEGLKRAQLIGYQEYRFARMLHRGANPLYELRALLDLHPAPSSDAAQPWLSEHLDTPASEWFWGLFTWDEMLRLHARGVWPAWFPQPVALRPDLATGTPL